MMEMAHLNRYIQFLYGENNCQKQLLVYWISFSVLSERKNIPVFFDLLIGRIDTLDFLK